LEADVGDRLEGTAAAVAACVFGGASIVRVHDVRAMLRVVRMSEAIRAAALPPAPADRSRATIQAMGG
jgi:dihydropteroate synthase